MGIILDVRRAQTTDFKEPGDLIYVLGDTRGELGGTCIERQARKRLGPCPSVKPADARAVYRALHRRDPPRAGALLPRPFRRRALDRAGGMLPGRRPRGASVPRCGACFRDPGEGHRAHPVLRDAVPFPGQRCPGQPRAVGAGHGRLRRRAARRSSGRPGCQDRSGGSASRFHFRRRDPRGVGRRNGGGPVSGRRPTACVITGFGINADEELALAFEMAGGAARRVHVTDLIAEPSLLDEFRILAFPGGFSFGDHLGSGKVFATLFRRNLGPRFAAFVDRGGLVIGICNGFQVLVKMGVLPNLSGDARQEVSLIHNDSGRYEDRWVRVSFEEDSRCVWTRGLKEMDLPVRHGEGRFVTPSPEFLADLRARGLVALRYVVACGRRADVPRGSQWVRRSRCRDLRSHGQGVRPHAASRGIHPRRRITLTGLHARSPRERACASSLTASGLRERRGQAPRDQAPRPRLDMRQVPTYYTSCLRGA